MPSTGATERNKSIPSQQLSPDDTSAWSPTVIAANQRIFTRHIQGTLRALRQIYERNDTLDQPLTERLLTTLDLALAATEVPLWETAWQILFQLHSMIEQQGYYAQWIPLLERARGRTAQAQRPQVQAALTWQLGNLLRLRGDWDAATAEYTRAIQTLQTAPTSATLAPSDHPIQPDHDVLPTHNSKQLIAQLHNELAYLARLQGKPTEAAALVDSALRAIGFPSQPLPLTTATDDVTSLDVPISALMASGNLTVIEFSYFVLGTIAHDRGEFGPAERYLQLALACCEAMDQRRKIAQRRRDVALILARQGELNKAKRLLEESIAQFDAFHDHVAGAICRMNLGIVYSQLGDAAGALDWYAAAQPILEEAQRETSLALLHNNQGVDYRKLGQYDAAIYHFQASIMMRRRLSNPRSLANVLDNLGRTYIDSGDRAAAKVAFAEALELLASVEDDTQVRQLRTGIQTQLAQLAAQG